MQKKGEIMQANVLESLAKTDRPMTAYDILAALKVHNAKLAPPTIYRALSALTEQGKVHRIESLNAYVACQCDGHEDIAVIAICDDCGSVDEQYLPEVIDRLGQASEKVGFTPKRHVIELHGSCASCEEVSN
ncbi:MAG: Fur family transcriptional regulator [Pseudomonadota bacterium]